MSSDSAFLGQTGPSRVALRPHTAQHLLTAEGGLRAVPSVSDNLSLIGRACLRLDQPTRSPSTATSPSVQSAVQSLLKGKMAHDRGSGSRSPKMLRLMLEAVADAHLHRARERRIRIAHKTGIPQSEDDARCQTY